MSENCKEPSELETAKAPEIVPVNTQEAEGTIPFGNIPPMPTQEAIDGIRFDFNEGARVYFPDGCMSYRLRFVDIDYKFTIYDVVTPNGKSFVAKSYRKYYVNFRIILSEPKTDQLLWSHDYNASGKDVVIRFPVHTLGDSIAWFSYVERFQKKLNCRLSLVVSKWLSEIVEKQYPDIHFCTTEEAEQIQSYANYNIGLYEIGNQTYQPIDHRYVGLHKFAAKILGVSDEEIPPRFDLSAPRQVKDKYVCIAVQSTGLCKMWNNPIGWRTVVEWLKNNGYRVLCIDRESFTGKQGTYTYIPPNAEDFTGDRPLQERINLIKDADCFIGLSSGLSWLAWGCNVPIVLISGFTEPWNEFYTPFRVINPNVCHGCWNDLKDFDLADYWNCPRQKNTQLQFECTAQISPEYVIGCVQQALNKQKQR